MKSLFEDQIFEFSDSKANVLIQAADIIAGTWGKILDPSIPIDFRTSLKESIKNNALIIDYWPPSKHSIFIKDENNDYLNTIVKQHCHQLAQDFIEEHYQTFNLDPDEAVEIECRLATLRYLLFQNEIKENHDFIYAKIIIEHLKEIGFEELSLRRFASLVISPLRDSGVIIASGNKGYRIPTTVDDIIEFARTTSEKVIPMVIRLGRARDQIHLASEGHLDIVSESGNDIINRFIEIQKEAPISPQNH